MFVVSSCILILGFFFFFFFWGGRGWVGQKAEILKALGKSAEGTSSFRGLIN